MVTIVTLLRYLGLHMQVLALHSQLISMALELGSAKNQENCWSVMVNVTQLDTFPQLTKLVDILCNMLVQSD